MCGLRKAFGLSAVAVVQQLPGMSCCSAGSATPIFVRLTLNSVGHTAQPRALRVLSLGRSGRVSQRGGLLTCCNLNLNTHIS